MDVDHKAYSAKTLIWYANEETGDGPVFVRFCLECGQFVKADESVCTSMDGVPSDEPNATCKKHGRVRMPFYCWNSDFVEE
ncbi:MAG: hypothetical protein CVU43_04595 [Chloroflexi bacterium HGW-Chloroflexi-5]|jgi:hypothetical protein|nr:MAG: hypothetical protein CVU43_04595 [Chloroflexi bacterium HGW-Chloroflexi-5]